jgi:carbamoyltransferase
MVQWVKNAMDQTGIRNVAFAGGVFLNVKANREIINIPGIKKTLFYPAAGDAGTAVGAALKLYNSEISSKRRRFAVKDLYYGVEFTDEEIKKFIDKSKWKKKAHLYKDVEGVFAENVAKGKVIARFNGRLEWGPRALGNRSIVANPSNRSIVKVINDKIKNRTWWMPFAPSILSKGAKRYLKKPSFSPYMVMAFETTEKRDEIIAAIHPHDFTCRPHVVNEWNPSYKRLLENFEKETGISAVLNTSFNLHGYPIVHGPKEAIWTFENSELDGLQMGNYLIMR